jgi:putative ABC transport system permease protein
MPVTEIRRLDVLGMILGESATLAGCGVAIGGAGAAMLARIAKVLLYGVTPTDPTAFTIALVLLITVAFVAAAIPAYQGAQLDPAATLRSE